MSAVLVDLAVVVLQDDYQDRPPRAPLEAFKDVWANPHARLVVIVTFIENIGRGDCAAHALRVPVRGG